MARILKYKTPTESTKLVVVDDTQKTIEDSTMEGPNENCGDEKTKRARTETNYSLIVDGKSIFPSPIDRRCLDIWVNSPELNMTRIYLAHVKKRLLASAPVEREPVIFDIKIVDSLGDTVVHCEDWDVLFTKINEILTCE